MALDLPPVDAVEHAALAEGWLQDGPDQVPSRGDLVRRVGDDVLGDTQSAQLAQDGDGHRAAVLDVREDHEQIGNVLDSLVRF